MSKKIGRTQRTTEELEEAKDKIDKAKNDYASLLLSEINRRAEDQKLAVITTELEDALDGLMCDSDEEE